MSTGPLLRTDLRFIDQVIAGERFFIVKDLKTQGYFRFRPVEAQVMQLFDGIRSASDVAAVLVAGGVKLSASTVDGFARKLGTMGLLQRSLQERSVLMLERLRAERGRKRSLYRGEVLRMRFPFPDTEPFIARTYPYIRWCFTRTFVIVSVVLFALYFGILMSQNAEYTHDVAALFSAKTFSFVTFFVLFVSFAVIVGIHELGHAYTCKHFGGEVHEMGAMLMYFVLPCFYANVNDAWGFSERRQRLWVTAAGSWIMLVVAAVSALFWLVLPRGSIAAQVAVCMMMVGGIFNIVTNMNPLLPLDGYFALGDFTGISNLRQQSAAYSKAWINRHVLRAPVVVPLVDVREHRIFLVHGILSMLFRLTIYKRLAGYLVALAAWLGGAAGVGVLALLLLRKFRQPIAAVGTTIRRLWGSIVGNRSPLRVTVVALVVLTFVAAVVPFDLTTTGRFTVVPAAASVVTAPATGTIAAVFVREGDAVAVGAPLLRLVDDALGRDQLAEQRAADEFTIEARRAQAQESARARDSLVAESDIRAARARSIGGRRTAMRVRALTSGTVMTRAEILVGRGVLRGDTLLLVSDPSVLDAIVRLEGAGTADVQVGQRVRLLSYQDVWHSVSATVTEVSTVGDARGRRSARVRLAPGVAWRSGGSGEAQIISRRSTLLGAAMWALRSSVRSDLLLGL